jgi:hypothetical protein
MVETLKVCDCWMPPVRLHWTFFLVWSQPINTKFNVFSVVNTLLLCFVFKKKNDHYKNKTMLSQNTWWRVRPWFLRRKNKSPLIWEIFEARASTNDPVTFFPVSKRSQRCHCFHAQLTAKMKKTQKPCNRRQQESVFALASAVFVLNKVPLKL